MESVIEARSLHPTRFTYDFSKYFAGENFKCNTVRASIVEVSPRFLIARKEKQSCFA